MQPFALATDGDTLYSSSNDGGIRVWSMKGDQVTELSSTGADVGALHVYDRQLYAGDEDGNVSGQDKGIKLLLLLTNKSYL